MILAATDIAMQKAIPMITRLLETSRSALNGNM
jgi:hypothetical protein